MKSNELMIGDYVFSKCGGNNEKVCYLTYEGIWLRFDERYSEVVNERDIEPIPLTIEILQKNGFENISKELYVYYNSAADRYIKVRLSDLLDGEWELAINNYDKFNDSHMQYTIDRCFLKVHELQHAMKLCGIEKEIVL